MLAACGAGDDTGATTTAGDETTTTSGSESMAGVHTAETDLGTILVDPDGFTLYVFTADQGPESTCYDACADLWPPVPADTEIGSDLDPAMFGSTMRTDGSEQLTVNDQPLYLYTPDQSPGDTTGQGVNNVWFVVDGAGSMIGGPQTSGDSSTTAADEGDDGLDY